MAKLLTRDAFREGVFARDQHRCVLCQQPAVDAHHIIERRLWPDSGYYLENGASVCGACHIRCEETNVSVEDVRLACGIRKILVPEHLYPDQPYDKWGNPVLQNGQRVRGELFDDASVQKVLERGGVLDLFTHYVKYPRTHHLPWSEGIHDDDRVLKTLERFEGQRCIATTKMDGEQTSMYSDYIHARSVDGRSHPSRDWVKQFWAQRAADIPEFWRVCGENLFAQHSLKYDALPSYFMGFSVWDHTNTCLDWDTTMEWMELLDITPVPVLYDGIFDEKIIRALWDNSQWGTSEGIVLRLATSFSYRDFQHCVGKFVRKGHVQTGKHWAYGQRIVPNGLA